MSSEVETSLDIAGRARSEKAVRDSSTSLGMTVKGTRPYNLRHAPAAVFIFFPAATGAQLVAADFGQ
jgi:hypothetical protein